MERIIKYAYSELEDEYNSPYYETKEECIKEAKDHCDLDVIYIATMEKQMFYPSIDEDKLFDDATEQYLENAYTEKDWVDLSDVDTPDFVNHINTQIAEYINKNCPKSYYWSIKEIEEVSK